MVRTIPVTSNYSISYMKNLILIRNLSLVLAILLLTSCGDDFAFSTKYNYLEEDTKEWNIADSIVNKHFEMIDNKGITYSFDNLSTKTDFSTGRSGFLFIPVSKSLTENIYITCQSNYGLSFSLYLYAGFDSFGDFINMNFGDTNFSYDFKIKKLSSVGVKNAYISKIITEDGLEGENILSEVEIIDNYMLSGKKYAKVLHFCLKDFENIIDPLCITEIYYAKQIGLIKYVYNSGISVSRK